MLFKPNDLVTVQFHPFAATQTAMVKYVHDDAYERQQWEAGSSSYYYCIQYDDGTIDTYVNEMYLHPRWAQQNVVK